MGKRQAVVVGGGIHGITAALALADANFDVTLIEKNQELLQGTSGATHNRAHMGYHYPRSMETARECIRGLEYFRLKYPDALHYPAEAYYLIAKEGSKTTPRAFAAFCDHMKIPYERQWPSNGLIKKEPLAESFRVPEPCFNLGALVELFKNEAAEKQVRIRTDTVVTGSRTGEYGTHQVSMKHNNRIERLDADIVINATYACAGNLMDQCGLGPDRTEYHFHTTEVVIAKSHGQTLPALTVMDGPFISIMPYAGVKDHYLVYDVEFSVARSKKGFTYAEPDQVESNWEYMVAHKKKYFPILEDLEYVASLWGSRPVPVDDQIDSRHTRVISHHTAPGFYSILEGKFISGPLVAQKLVEIIEKDSLMGENPTLVNLRRQKRLPHDQEAGPGIYKPLVDGTLGRPLIKA